MRAFQVLSDVFAYVLEMPLNHDNAAASLDEATSSTHRCLTIIGTKICKHGNLGSMLTHAKAATGCYNAAALLYGMELRALHPPFLLKAKTFQPAVVRALMLPLHGGSSIVADTLLWSSSKQFSTKCTRWVIDAISRSSGDADDARLSDSDLAPMGDLFKYAAWKPTVKKLMGKDMYTMSEVMVVLGQMQMGVGDVVQMKAAKAGKRKAAGDDAPLPAAAAAAAADDIDDSASASDDEEDEDEEDDEEMEAVVALAAEAQAEAVETEEEEPDTDGGSDEADAEADATEDCAEVGSDTDESE
jgi:hypothetical protein